MRNQTGIESLYLGIPIAKVNEERFQVDSVVHPLVCFPPSSRVSQQHVFDKAPNPWLLTGASRFSSNRLLDQSRNIYIVLASLICVVLTDLDVRNILLTGFFQIRDYDALNSTRLEHTLYLQQELLGDTSIEMLQQVRVIDHINGT